MRKTCDEHCEQADVGVHSHKVEKARAHGHAAGLPCQAVAHRQVGQNAQEAVCQLFSLHAHIPLSALNTQSRDVMGSRSR